MLRPLLLVLLSGWLSTTAWSQASIGAARLERDDVSVNWQAGKGLTIAYKGVEAFVPYSQEFTVHDSKWAKTFFSSSQFSPAAEVLKDGPARVLSITYSGESFSCTKRVTLAGGGKVRVDYEFAQTGLEDAHLQLGWRPAVHWLDGAMYEVTAGEQAHKGQMTYGRADRRVLWSSMANMQFTSVFGRWRLDTTHGMTLYDDRHQNTFFLGWDQELAEGVTYGETVELAFAPAGEAAPGLTLSEFDWSREGQGGHAGVSCGIARTAQGPKRITARLAATLGGEVRATDEKSLALEQAPSILALKVALPQPGDYELSLTAADASDGSELLRVQGLKARVDPVLSFFPSLSLYTHEAEAELVVRLLQPIPTQALEVTLTGASVGEQTIPLTQSETAIPIALGKLPDGKHDVLCTLVSSGEVIAKAAAGFYKAPPKANEVKIDHRSRGLIVDGKPFFPFGFYTHAGRFYDQEDPNAVLDLEAAHKFNMVCVYHNFDSAFRKEQRGTIRAFLDEADAVGMRMHYDVRQLTDQEPSEAVSGALSDDIKAFRDHPALLCWYLSDEPAGRKLPADRFIAHNAHLKGLDPHHPTTMVFCVPSKAHEYAQAMDILMVDPYPIPNRSVTNVADTVDLVLRATGYTMPVWCVPQAFGGGEWWGREPTRWEQRCMTYLAIVHGATGIQYFVRRPPHNTPFTDGMWAECRQLAAEIKELTPVLLSHEPVPEVVCVDEAPGIHVAARTHQGLCYVLCVNTDKQPRRIALQCSVPPRTPRAQVVFEDRSVAISPEGRLEDMIDGLGVRVYAYATTASTAEAQSGQELLLRNGSFEQQANPGFPDYFRGRQAGHPGASWGTDTLEAYDGRHSLYLRCPAQGQGPTVASYPMSLPPGKYRLELQAKAGGDGHAATFTISGFAHAPSLGVELSRQWQPYSLDFTVPEGTRRVHFSARGNERGTIWVDAVHVSNTGEM